LDDIKEHPACNKKLGARITAPAVTTTSIILSSNISRMETFWYRLIQVHLEKWPREREGEGMREGGKRDRAFSPQD